MGRVSRRSLLRGGLGIAISVVAIWLLVRAVDIAAASEVLRTASPAWMAVMVVTVFLDVGARGARWRAFSRPIAPSRTGGSSVTRTSATSPTTSCRRGSGELYRSHRSAKGGISRTTVLGTVVVERVVDTVVVVAIAAIAVLVLSIRGVMTSAVLLGLAFASLLVLVLGSGGGPRLPGADRVAAIIARGRASWPSRGRCARASRSPGTPDVAAAARSAPSPGPRRP